MQEISADFFDNNGDYIGNYNSDASLNNPAPNKKSTFKIETMDKV
jgi:hypothetical protein